MSVIICAYALERWPALLAALESIHAQTVRPHEIILVIDHQPDLWARAHYALTDVIVIENHQAPGLAGARNSGLALATGDIVAFMDQDAVAASDWLAQLIDYYADPHVLGVGGTIEPVWQPKRPDWFPEEFDWVVGCTYRGLPTATSRVRNLIGCNMSFRREAAQSIGGFRPGLGRIGTLSLGCEETELCIRLKQHQPHGRLVYEPRSRVFHWVPPARSTWRYFTARCFTEGLSKAQVTRLVGAKAGLSTEWAYVLKTLPLGITRDLADVVRHGDGWGVMQAAVMVSGFALTLAGFVVGRLRLLFNAQPADQSPGLTMEESVG